MCNTLYSYAIHNNTDRPVWFGPVPVPGPLSRKKIIDICCIDYLDRVSAARDYRMWPISMRFLSFDDNVHDHVRDFSFDINMSIRFHKKIVNDICSLDSQT